MKAVSAGLIAATVLAGVLIAAGYLYFTQPAPEFHAHADFAVFLDGEQLNFSQDKYMETQECGKPGQAPDGKPAHLHGGVGWVVHAHRANATWGEFFSSLGMGLNGSCFTDDSNRSYCSDGLHSLKMRLNWLTVNGDLGGMVIGDLDRVLISYGNDSQESLAGQLAAVTNYSCAYDGKCPQYAKALNLPPETDCAS